MTTPAPDTLATSVANAEQALQRLRDVVGGLGDGDLHRAHRGGGWSAAQVISHISLSAVLFLGDLQRLRDDPDLDFFFREEVGHDAVGYPPPTVEAALGRIDSTRRALATSLPAVGAEVLARRVEIPDLGTMTIGEWIPPIVGHITGHVDQIMDLLADRGVPTGQDRR